MPSYRLLADTARYGSAAAAPPPRTLIDILEAGAAANPHAAALDDGAARLDYVALLAAVRELAERFAEAGVGRGDRVGVHIPSGTAELYLAILGVLAAGAAYVPVDVDDPPERAALVFGEAGVRAVIGEGLRIELTERHPVEASSAVTGASAGAGAAHPLPEDDAWIIFTSGSTGTPKGVAVTHRAAAAFVDAEARLFLRRAPLGPGDRVLAGLSVAFDASCEEMWLAWRHGACLVPAPRALVRSGVDLGPWLLDRGITAVSTVPTLAALWPAEALDHVRLLIFGGEACPPELAERLAVDGREVWNTYGPTEATVVATAAQLTGTGPVRIGLPLDGWELAVVDPTGHPVAPGESGELVIAGVGLARYLDPEKDAAKYAPLPAAGWDRAYRSGDLVRADPAGLVFLGRADEQVKLGGRRIELGEIDAALQALPGVAAAAAAVKGPAGGQVLVGYVVARTAAGNSAAASPKVDVSAPVKPVTPFVAFDPASARALLATRLPAALVPRIVVVVELPTRTSGKVDRQALPWPVAADAAADGLSGPPSGVLSGDGSAVGPAAGPVRLTPAQEQLADHWSTVLGSRPIGLSADFFDAGGSSLAAARLVSVLRTAHPTVTVRDVYDNPSFTDLADRLADLAPAPTTSRSLLGAHDETSVPRPIGRGFQSAQIAAMLPISVLGAMRWLTALAVLGNLLSPSWAPRVSWWLVLAGFVLFVTPPGRLLISALAARLLLRGVIPGDYPRGGGAHLRLWTAQILAERLGSYTTSAGPWLPLYARVLGARVGRHAVLHSPPPITGHLRVDEGGAVEPEVDLTAHWVDGDVVHVGAIRIGAWASVGTRSTLLPGARIGAHARIAPGSAVATHVPAAEHWAGSPAERVRPGKGARSGGKPFVRTAKSARAPAGSPPSASQAANSRSRHAQRSNSQAPDSEPAAFTPQWSAAYGLTALLLGLLPLTAAVPALAVLIAVGGSFGSSLGSSPDTATTPWPAFAHGLAALAPAVFAFFLTFAVLIFICIRVLSLGMRPGDFPLHSLPAWRVWTTTQLMEMARVWLYPLYASIATPIWLRLLGMKVGHDVEASTVLAVPAMTSVDHGAFLADDTMIAPYELAAGRLSVGQVRIGKRVFVGNSGMVGPGRKLPKGSLVGVLSAAPAKAKRGKSYLGMPPERLRRANQNTDSTRTYHPPPRLKFARAVVEFCRVIPALITAALALLVVALLAQITTSLNLAAAVLLAGPVILLTGWLGAAIAVAAKWLLVGRIAARDQPLWSSFVWRNELADNFIELIGAPWFAEPWLGTAVLTAWLRALGSRIGRGVWCETYWLPEADLIVLADGATVNRGCVVQTHLFHDRVMSMDLVTLHEGATLGPQCVILPAAGIGTAATVGPASLVMRGEAVPPRSRWTGNPIAPWPAEKPE